MKQEKNLLSRQTDDSVWKDNRSVLEFVVRVRSGPGSGSAAFILLLFTISPALRCGSALYSTARCQTPIE